MSEVRVSSMPPLQPDTLLAALSAASSPQATPQQISAATEYLTHHTQSELLLDMLCKIICTPPEQVGGVRIQALIVIKNNIDRWWRPCSGNQVSEARKAQARASLLEVLAAGESNTVVLKTLSVCVGKIGRFDFPKHWPDVFENLMVPMQNAISNPLEARNSAILYGCLSAFHQIIKSLASNRMVRGQLLMRQVSEQYFGAISTFYHICLKAWTAQITNFTLTGAIVPPSPTLNIQLSRISLKILNKMSLYGWSRPDQNTFLVQFFNENLTTMSQLCQLRYNFLIQFGSHFNSSYAPLVIHLTKHVLSYGKILQETLRHSTFPATSMDNGRWLKNVIDTQWVIIETAVSQIGQISDDQQSLIPTQMVIRSLIILKHSTSSLSWGSDLPPLSSSQIHKLFLILIDQLLPLRPLDIATWEEDPEDFIVNYSSDGEQWKVNLHQCAQHLLTCLLRNATPYTPELQQMVVRMWADAMAQGVPTTIEGIVRKAGNYTTIGLSSSEVKRQANLDASLEVLELEVLSTDPRCKILKCRIAWLLGEWIKEDNDAIVKQRIFQLVNHLLKPSAASDLAVQLAAVGTLIKFDRSNVEPILFHPFLETALMQVIELIGQSATVEGQNWLAKALVTVIEQGGSAMAQWAPQVFEAFMSLWYTISEAQFKGSILSALQQLVIAIGPSCQPYHDKVASIVANSVDPDMQPVTLTEAATLLWLEVLQQSTEMSSALLQLLPSLVKLINPQHNQGDHENISLRILQSYFLLDIHASLEFENLLTHVVELMSTTQDSNLIRSITIVITLLIKLVPSQRWALILSESGIFSFMLNVIKNKNDSMIKANYLVTLSHVIMSDHTVFFQLLNQLQPQNHGVNREWVQGFVIECVDEFDTLNNVHEQKIVACAVAVLLPFYFDYSQMTAITLLWCNLLSESEEEKDPDGNFFRFCNKPEEMDEFESTSMSYAEVARIVQMKERDPLRSQTCRQLLTTLIQEAQRRVGAQLFAHVDVVLVNELQQRLQGTLKG